jgi:hypothetical protein
MFETERPKNCGKDRLPWFILSWARASTLSKSFQIRAVERRIAELLGSPVDLLPEPVEKRRLQDRINRDRRRAF